MRHIAELRIANGLYAGFTADQVVNLMRERVARGTVSHITSKLADGRTLTVSIRPLPDGGWVTTHQDITEREELNTRLAEQNELLQRREAELRAQNAQIDTAINNMSRGLCLFDAGQRILVANRRYAEMYDLSAEQVKPGTTLREILELRAAKGHFCGQSTEAYIAERLAVVAAGKTASATHRLPDGRVVAVGHYPTPDGGWVTTHDDITEREQLNARLAEQNALLQRREDELEAQNMRFDAAMRYMSQGLCLFDADQRVVLANDRYAKIYGLTPEQIRPGTTLRQIFEARACNGVYNHLDMSKFVETGVRGFRDEVSEIVHLSDGRFISVLRRPMPDGGLVSTHEDVTERQRLKLHMAQQNEQLDAALNNMSQGLVMFDSDQRIVVCNERYAEMYRLTPEQAKPGTTVRQILEYRLANGCCNKTDPAHFVDDLVAQFQEQVQRHSRAGRRADHQRAAPRDGERRLGRHPRGHHRASQAQCAARGEQQAARRAHLPPADHHRQLPRRHRVPRPRPAGRGLQRQRQAAAGRAGLPVRRRARPPSRTYSAPSPAAASTAPATSRSRSQRAWP